MGRRAAGVTAPFALVPDDQPITAANAAGKIVVRSMTDDIAAAELHPWNTAFTWERRRGPFRVLTADLAHAFDDLGFVVIPDLFDAATIGAVREEIDAFEAEVDAALQRLDGGRVSIAETGAITFSVHLVARSPALRAFTCHPRLVDLAADLIGPDVRLYWDQAVYKKPEKPRRFPWHQDNGYAFVEPQQYLTVWIALTDATVDNGCPWIVPGVHHRGTLQHHYVEPLGYECLTDPPDAVAAEVPAGGAVVFSSLTPHLTGPNTTNAVRKAYIVQYAPTGAEVLQGDPSSGPPTERVPATAPERQYEVLRGGEPAAPPVSGR